MDASDRYTRRFVMSGLGASVLLPAGLAWASKPRFTRLREETFSCGGQTYRVEIYKCHAFAQALGIADDQSDIACEFIKIPDGSFLQGSGKAEQDAMARAEGSGIAGRYNREHESPQRTVTVPSFLLARTPVTKTLWRELALLSGSPPTPSFFQHSDERAPVEQVSWVDVRQWIHGVNQMHFLSLRLPSESEWEYACRAGTTTPLYNGDMTILGVANCPEIDEIGWYMGNCAVDYEGAVDSSNWPQKQYPHTRAGTLPVGLKRENAFGLYDMMGNVMEWTEDWSHKDYVDAPTDGSAWTGGDWIPGSLINGPVGPEGPHVTVRDGTDVPGRVRRGGSWRQLAFNFRSALRSHRGPNFTDANHGFRVAAAVPAGL